MKKWQCSVCRYIHDGNQPPAECPKCGAAAEKFTEVLAEQSVLIDRARKTNQCHMELSTLLEEVKTVAEIGLADELDPPCVSIFKKTIQTAAELQQAIKAELAGHVGKGKWG